MRVKGIRVRHGKGLISGAVTLYIDAESISGIGWGEERTHYRNYSDSEIDTLPRRVCIH